MLLLVLETGKSPVAFDGNVVGTSCNVLSVDHVDPAPRLDVLSQVHRDHPVSGGLLTLLGQGAETHPIVNELPAHLVNL